MPLVNSFLTKSDFLREKKYDLSVGFCPKCFLVQLTKSINPKKLFSDYIYFSSNSKTIIDHNKKTTEYLTEKLKLNKKSLVLEIASNDGAFLQFFKQKGINVLGVDPALNIVKVAQKKGIFTIADFFSAKLAKKLSNEKNIHADLIYGANVLAHVPNIVDFVRGVGIALKTKGTAVFESLYLGGIFENKFDIIYHEHVFYYSLLALINLFKKADLDIYDFDIIDMQGGSFRIFICHKGQFKISGRVKKQIRLEMKKGYSKINTYYRVNKNVTKLKSNLINLLKNIKKKNMSIAAYSAPAKGIILLNYFGIGENYLDFIVDRAKEKQGLYTPGTHLLVKPVQEINLKKPDYVLILSWNIYKEIIKIEELIKFKKRGGKFILPIPKVTIF